MVVVVFIDGKDGKGYSISGEKKTATYKVEHAGVIRFEWRAGNSVTGGCGGAITSVTSDDGTKCTLAEGIHFSNGTEIHAVSTGDGVKVEEETRAFIPAGSTINYSISGGNDNNDSEGRVTQIYLDNNAEPVQTYYGPSLGASDYQYTVEQSGHVKFRVYNDGTINSGTHVTIKSIIYPDGKTQYKIN